MIFSLYHNKGAQVNQPRPWPWPDVPPRSLKGARARRRASAPAAPESERRIVLDAPAAGRTRVRRKPERGRYDRATIDAILDEAMICHLSTIVDGWPATIPTAFVRAGDEVIVHGSTGSRVLRALAGGAPACVEVTLLDGLVLARSAMHHSMNYRSVVAYGTFRRVSDPGEALRASEALVEHLVPSRWREVRPPSRKELAATTILAMRLDEVSAKVRTGPPVDEGVDMTLEAWAGEVPLALVARTPVPDPALQPGVELSPAAERLLERNPRTRLRLQGR